MTLAVPYENVHDASMRLTGTVVLYDNEPVYITDVREVGPEDPKGDVFRVYASPLPYNGAGRRGEEMRKFISSKKFDMAPFPMGFMNMEGNTYYCSRLPRRQQRQGLSAGTFSSVLVGTDVGMYRLENLLGRQEFLDCIKGNYPNFREAFERIEQGDFQSCAFHRCFALKMDEQLPELVYLYHKKDRVGFVMDGRIKLSKAGRCLIEALREAGVEC